MPQTLCLALARAKLYGLQAFVSHLPAQHLRPDVPGQSSSMHCRFGTRLPGALLHSAANVRGKRRVAKLLSLCFALSIVFERLWQQGITGRLYFEFDY